MERRGKREWSTSEGKGEVDRERERSGMGGSCGSKPTDEGSELMEEGSKLMDVDRSSWRRDRSSWMWIDLAGAGVLVCDRGGAWINRALTVAWRGWRRRSDWRDLSLSLSLCTSVSPFSSSFSLCASPEMIWSENNNGKYFTPRCPYFTVNTENIFSLTQFSVTTKHPLFRKSISGSGLKPKQTQHNTLCVHAHTHSLYMSNISKFQIIFSLDTKIISNS